MICSGAKKGTAVKKRLAFGSDQIMIHPLHLREHEKHGEKTQILGLTEDQLL